MKPKPWSSTALDDFVNCPRQYYEKRVIKTVPEVETEEMRWGTILHRHFELRQKDQTPLPKEVDEHEPFMQRLAQLPGTTYTEQKVALSRHGHPCPFFGPSVWWRGIIDYRKVHANEALIIDYKTGKPHQKFGQLKLFALYTFASDPEVETVTTKYYWTRTKSMTGATYTRGQSSALWAEFIPNLKQYVEAYKTDTWQPRQSGLCYGWCPVTHCEFWKPKRSNR
jgi:hypothetical protein